MKVAELIELLKQFDPNLDLLFDDTYRFTDCSVETDEKGKEYLNVY